MLRQLVWVLLCACGGSKGEVVDTASPPGVIGTAIAAGIFLGILG